MRDPIGPAAIALVAATAWLLIVFLVRSYRKRIDDIHRLGGYSVMRADIGEGRTLERYWNAKEEVVIEHGSDGTSCLVDLRSRR